MYKKKNKAMKIFFLLEVLIIITSCFVSLGFATINDGEDSPHRKLNYDDETGQFLGATDATPTGISYMLVDHWGGNWSDAEKLPYNTEDDLLCWAASASNILEWTGWGLSSGMWNTDQMFQYFLDHWTDQGGLQIYGWDWWFDGTNPSQGWPGWSQVDVPGGNFWPSYSFSSYYHEDWDDWDALSAVDVYLHSGYGVGLAIYTDTGGGHAITVWGYNYNPSNPSDYYGIWISDSDDYKSYTDPPDKLRYYEVSYSGGRWYLQNYYSSYSWYIGGVTVLAPFPSARPVADAGGPYMGGVGSPVAFDGSGSTDAEGDPLKYRWDFDRDNFWDTGWSTSPMATYTWSAEHTGTVALQVYDGHTLDVDTATITILSSQKGQIEVYAPRWGAADDEFIMTDDVHCRGYDFNPYDEIDIYLVEDLSGWTSGINLKELNFVSLVTVEVDGARNLPSTLLLSAPLPEGVYDIIADVDQDGVYNEEVDVLNENCVIVSSVSMFVVPELPVGTIFSLVACLAALVLKGQKI